MSFRLNIERRYHPDNYNHAERLQRGIGEAIAMHEQSEAENREFENEVAMNDGTLIPGESRLARIKRIGGGVAGAVRRKLPGYDPLPAAEENLGRQPRPSVGVTPSRAGATAPIRAGSPEVDMPGRPSIGGALGEEIDEPEEERTVIRGPHGQSAIVPTKRGRAQTAARAERADWMFKEGVQQQGRINLEKSKNRATEAEKQANRMALVERRAQIRRQLDDGSLTAYQRRSLELRQEALDAAIDRAETSNQIDADAALARMPAPDAIDRRIEARDPTQAAATARTDAQRAAARKRLEDRGKGKTYSTDPARRKAQELWDSSPAIQKARPRPQ